ncbi:MAG: hypothetical protein ACT4QF_02765 [Sporichthyaceae bacterium]
MRPTTGSTTLAPRLLLLFALVVCVLGFGQPGASAAPPGVAATVAGAAAAQAAPHSPAVAPEGASAASPLGAPYEHGAHGDHALSCVSTSGAVALGALLAPDVAAVVRSVVTAMSRVRTAIAEAAYPRPPDIAALCVQRI